MGSLALGDNHPKRRKIAQTILLSFPRIHGNSKIIKKKSVENHDPINPERTWHKNFFKNGECTVYHKVVTQNMRVKQNTPLKNDIRKL